VAARLTDLDKSGGFEAAFYFTVWERIKRQVSRFQNGAIGAGWLRQAVRGEA
jgi:hypothetical protein